MDHSPTPLELGRAAHNAPRARAWGIERSALRRLLAALGHPPVEIELWSGEVFAGKSATPAVARLVIRDRGALWRMLASPELYPGDDYAAGRIEISGDLLAFLTAISRGLDALPERSWRARLVQWANRPRANTLAGSRRHIRHHYDLGNDFYRLWLDRAAMQYTCAYFESPDASLETAQLAKLGWGGLALHLARHYGVRVRAFNISEEPVLDVENLRLHYVQTLGHWLARFNQHKDRVRALLNARFVRMWRLYLASSQAAFPSGALQLFQVVFARGDDKQLPRSRRHLYPEAQ